MKRRLMTGVMLAALAVAAQDEHHKTMDARGDQAMGFSHEKTTHHFRVYADGGAIEVTANDAKDAESTAQIRMHLGHIARMFAAGDFQAPMLVHSQTPPGVGVLQRLKNEVSYRYQDIDRGGRVRIATKNPEALAAVYQFLKFQIADHQTGDTTEVTKEGSK